MEWVHKQHVQSCAIPGWLKNTQQKPTSKGCRQNNHKQFPRKVGFSSTLFFLFGAINGTRIAIKVALIYPVENYNRKSFYFLILQGICDRQCNVFAG